MQLTDGKGTLHLKNVDPRVHFISTDKERKVGYASLEDTQKLWDKGFKDSPPNAILSYGEKHFIALEINSMTYDPRDGATFKVSSLKEMKTIDEERLSESSLFVDGIGDDFRGLEPTRGSLDKAGDILQWL